MTFTTITFAEHFIKQRGAARKHIDDAFARLTYTTDLAAAVRDADLICLGQSAKPSAFPRGVILENRRQTRYWYERQLEYFDG